MNNDISTVKINLVYVFLVIIMSVLQVVILNSNSTSGEQLTVMGQKIQALENENIKLSQHIASASALTTISAKASSYGYVNDLTMVSLTQPLPIAFSGSPL